MFLKEKKEFQSVFATDTVRCNYSIKEYINAKKNKWVIDKGANKVTKLIIDPLFSHIIKELKSHLQKENDKLMISGTKKSNDYIEQTIAIDNDAYLSDDSTCSENLYDPKNKKTAFVRYDKNDFKKNKSESESESESEAEPNNSKSINKNEEDEEEEEEEDEEEEDEEDEEDYMIRSTGQKIQKSENNDDEDDKPKNDKSLVVFNPFVNQDKLKNPDKYHKDLTVKERDAIIKESVKIVNFIRDIENGSLTKEVLKYVTKFYQLDKSYFE